MIKTPPTWLARLWTGWQRIPKVTGHPHPAPALSSLLARATQDDPLPLLISGFGDDLPSAAAQLALLTPAPCARPVQFSLAPAQILPCCGLSLAWHPAEDLSPAALLHGRYRRHSNPAPDHVTLLAVLSFGDEVLSSAEGHASAITGAEDPVLAALLRQTVLAVLEPMMADSHHHG